MSPGPIDRAAAALRYWEQRQTAVAGNLANAGADGFKGERVFAQLLEDGTLESSAALDLRAGALQESGNPLDVALGGEGFFVVRTEDGDRLTRNGSFRLDESGTLTDSSGNEVLTEQGPLVLPPGSVEISPDGSVTVDGQSFGALRVVGVSDPSLLEREGGQRFRASEEALQPMEHPDVRQGYLEASNVDPLSSMVEMMEISRSHRSIYESMTALDGVMETITTRIGRFG